MLLTTCSLINGRSDSKVRNPKNPGDFRLISVSPVLPKVYERLIMHPMVSMLETKEVYLNINLVYCTIITCLQLREHILKAMDRGA